MEPFAGAWFFMAFIVIVFIFMILICCSACTFSKPIRSSPSPTSYSVNNAAKKGAAGKRGPRLYFIGYPHKSHHNHTRNRDDDNTHTYVSASNEIDVPDNMIQNFVDEISERDECADHRTHHHQSSADDNHNSGGHSDSYGASWGGHNAGSGGHDSGWGGHDSHGSSWGGHDSSYGGHDSGCGGDGGGGGGDCGGGE